MLAPISPSLPAGAPNWSTSISVTSTGIRGCNSRQHTNIGASGIRDTWTPKVCRIMAFYRFWATIIPTFGGLGRSRGKMSQSTMYATLYMGTLGLGLGVWYTEYSWP